MSDFSVLKQLVIVLTATLSIVFICNKLKLPTILGFLFAGVVIGPAAFGFIEGVHEIELLAEIGIVLLLFTIGLEFSLADLLTARRSFLGAGALQVLLTTGLVVALSLLLGQGIEVGVFAGFLISLSSTAIVLKMYSDRRETDSIQGRLATGVLLFQDLCIVPMMLLVPILGRGGEVSVTVIAWALLKAVLVLGTVVVAARKALPWLLRQVAVLRNREIFLLFVCFVCLGTAWLTSELGLSLALGAFMAGLLISESEFSHQIVADILPLRDCFSGIFFISIGMLLNLRFLADNVLTSMLNLLLIIGVKGAVIFVVYWILYRSLRLGTLLALSLSQVGEFSFILAKTGQSYGFLSAGVEQAFLAASILSMVATPLLIHWAHGLAFGLETALGKVVKTAAPDAGESPPKGGHVVIVGYGLNGQNLTRVLKEVGIAYRILDMDPDLIRRARMAGEPIHFGDGTRPEVLEGLAIQQARVLVVAISDAAATVRIVWQARGLNPDLHIVVRTRYVAQIDGLYRIGANQVIPEEFETSVEIFARVLEEYHVPRNVIALQVNLIRRERYRMLRGLKLEGKSLDQLSQYLAGTTTDTVLLLKSSPALGRTLAELEVRAKFGVTIIAIVRGGATHHNPPGDFRLAESDILILLGSHEEIDRATDLFNPPAGENQ